MAVMQVSTQWVNSAIQGIKEFFKEKEETGGERERILTLAKVGPPTKPNIHKFERELKTYQEASQDKKLSEAERHVNRQRAEAYGQGLKILNERQAASSASQK